MAPADRDLADRGHSSSGSSGSEARRDPLVGSLVNGKYRVVDAIARGGMGRIYYATQVPLERPVALKVVQGDGDHEHESQFLKRFLQEASILAKLQHPNIVTLFDYGRIEDAHIEQYFIAMEFLAGETLAQRLKTRGRLSAAETLVLGRQIVRGLREAHKHGVVHRDLKPSNIILVPEGDGSEIVKLVDFGIGKVVGRGDNQDLTQDGVFVGTPRYMAPEQFEGSAFPASDFYALGTILFQALAGRVPFVGANMADFMVAKLARQVPTVRDVTPDAAVPDSLEALIYHLLARKPEERPTLEELHAHMMTCEEEVFGTGHSFRRGNSSGPHSFNQTGSGPYHLPYSGSVPVLPVISGSVPSIGPGYGGAASSSGPHSQPYGDPTRVPAYGPITGHHPMTQMTPRPMATAMLPMPSKPPSRAPLILTLLALFVLLASAGVYWQTTRTARDRAEGDDPTGTGSTAAGGETPTTVAFSLTIDSVPTGAEVHEGDKLLGETPLTISVDRSSVTAGPRTFIVTKQGFAASHVVQGASADSVKSVVSLAPLPSSALVPEAHPTVKSRPPVGARTPSVATAKPSVPQNTPPGPTDIRLKR